MSRCRVLASVLSNPGSFLLAVVASVVFVLVVAIPTDLVGTSLFSREIPPTWWAWPALVGSSVLGGLLAATYVREPGAAGVDAEELIGSDVDRGVRHGCAAAGILTFFAVGCPVCNKVVLVALGTTGAVTWFAPIQPGLQLAALLLMVWALGRRLKARGACPLPPSLRSPNYQPLSK